MARRKSPYGAWKRIQLKYREHDPRYAGLEDLLQGIPVGARNTRLLDLLFANLAAKGVAMPPSAPLPQSSKPSQNAQHPGHDDTFSNGATALLTQNWD